MSKHTDDKVMAAVEKALEKNAAATVDELYALATGVSKDVAKLSKRQFHARYPLQVKRRKGPAKRRGRKAAAKTKGRGRGRSAASKTNGSPRDGVREVFLQFAAELAAAEDRKTAVRVVAGVDRWVDRVLEAAR